MGRITALAGDSLRQQREAGRLRTLRWADGPQETWLSLDGQRVLVLCSNNYLGLANHPAVREAAARAARALGVGAGASRLISGSMRIHRELEERLAAFKHTEAALLFPSGYHANIAAITALAGKKDAIFSDALNHASIVDGCRLSGARVHVYPHCDTGVLESLLAATAAHRKLVVTDSVFSMDGDLAPLPGICAAAARHGAIVMVDEAHATGVLGATGAGAVEHFGVQAQVDVQVTTLGKALGAAGAAVCGERLLVDLLINRARTFIFTTAVPPPIAAAAAAALDVLEDEPERRARLQHNSRQLRSALRRLGYPVPECETPIVPLVAGENDTALRWSEGLLDQGVFVAAIRPPTVPPGTARLRITAMATHTDTDLEHAAAGFRAVLSPSRL